jgi:hypothetical protein
VTAFAARWSVWPRRSVDRDWRTEIANAIADGTPVDWEAVAAWALNEADREFVERLRLVEQVTRAQQGHGSQASADGGPSSGQGTRGAAAHDEPDPETWGPLQILARVGGGTSGVVYRAHDPRLDRVVALKLLRRPEPGRDATQAVVIEEGRLLARVTHPNVVTVYGAEWHDGRVGIWMEFIEGRTLDTCVREGGPAHRPQPLQRPGRGAQGRAAASRRESAERDAGARWARGADGLRRGPGCGYLTREADAPRSLVGTPLYLAPEMLEGQPASERSEIFGLGILLYCLATGTFPIQALTQQDLRDALTLTDLRDAYRRNLQMDSLTVAPELPPGLAQIIRTAIDADPAARYQSAADMQAALQALLTPAPQRRVGRGRMALAIATLLFVVGGAAFWWWRAATAGNPSLSDSQIQPLTLSGDATFGSISPDGQSIAYVRRDAGVWVRSLTTEQDVQVAPFVPGRTYDSVTITPDGEFVDYVAAEKTAHELWRVPLAGGTPSLVVRDVWSAPGWSPDGLRMAFIRARNSESDVVVADKDGSHQRVLATRRLPEMLLNSLFGAWTNRPAWSPDVRPSLRLRVHLAGHRRSTPSPLRSFLCHHRRGSAESDSPLRRSFL